MSGFLDFVGCVSNPFGCGVNWLDQLPVLAVIIISVAIGMLAGAHMGKPSVYAILTLGAALLFFRRSAEPEHEHVAGKDADPPRVVKRKGKRPTIFDGFKSLTGK